MLIGTDISSAINDTPCLDRHLLPYLAESVRCMLVFHLQQVLIPYKLLARAFSKDV